MSVTSTDLKNLIITTLSEADPTALTGLNANVPLYWNLWARQGVLPELQYWYTRREAIRYLMGCLNRQIDYARRSQTASRNATLSSRQDSQMDAAFNETASSNADRSSSSNYEDETNASGSGSSAGSRSGKQTMTDTASLTDDGSGSNSADQSSSLTTSSLANASSSDSMSAQRFTNREVCGDHTRTSYSVKESLGVPPLAVSTVSSTGEVEEGTITEAQMAGGNTASESFQDDARENHSTSTSDQSSSSVFNAHRLTSDVMGASGENHTRLSSSADYSSSGAGVGVMTGTGAGGSTMTVSGSRVAHADGEAHKVSATTSANDSTMEKLHQRFLHLKDLWVKANEMISWFEKQRLNLPAYTMQAIIIQYPSGVNADRANQFLVRTPFGLGNGQ